MSRLNKVNKTNYTQQGRLTPDEMARERLRQMPKSNREAEAVTGKARSSGERGPTRPRSAREERD